MRGSHTRARESREYRVHRKRTLCPNRFDYESFEDIAQIWPVPMKKCWVFVCVTFMRTLRARVSTLRANLPIFSQLLETNQPQCLGGKEKRGVINYAYLTLIQHLSTIYSPFGWHYDPARCPYGDNTVFNRTGAKTNLFKASLRSLLVLTDWKYCFFPFHSSIRARYLQKRSIEKLWRWRSTRDDC